MSRQLPDLPGGKHMKTAGSVGDVVWRIQRLTMLVRNAAQPLMGLRPLTPDQTPGPTPGVGQGPVQGPDAALGAQEQASGNWWVLAQGRILDPEDFTAREAAREDLLYSVLQAGVLVGENIWVWDETRRAQLVLATLPSQERARKVADRLRAKGLAITVRREIL